MGRQLAVHAGALSVLVLASLASPADAKPKRRDAAAAFDRGVAAYQKSDFAAASDALGKSFELEADPDTLFAWAQSERKLDHCDKAVELYEKLLAFTLPDANRAAVAQNRDECKQILAAQAPPPAAEPAPAPAPPPVMAAPAPTPAPASPESTQSWYKDPLSLGLVGGGVVGLGVGTGLLVSANSLNNQAHSARSYQTFHDDSTRAKSRGNLGIAVGAAGAVLTIGGVAWIVMHLRRDEAPPPVTGWLGPSGGGLAYTSGF